jgi:4-amino-4-deoxy-L-arabinose transferase-like glycosyltransferase
MLQPRSSQSAPLTLATPSRVTGVADRPDQVGGVGWWLGRIVRQPALWIALLTLALYLPSSARIVQLSPDMVEYVDIARRLVAGEGYTQGIKAYHVGSASVVEDGLVHRPPLLTLAIAALFTLGLGVQAVQAIHSLVGAASAVLVYSLGARLFGRPVGIAAGVLAATCAAAFKHQLPLMTEGLSALLILAGVWLLVVAVDRPTVRPFALAGLAFGVGYLARPPVLAVFAAVVVTTVLVAADRRRLVGPLVALGVGAAAMVVPMSVFSLVTRGRLVYLGKTYLYAVTSDRAVMEEGFVQPIPSAAEFITTHLGYIAQAVVTLAGLYTQWLFLDWEMLLPFLLGWPLVILALVRGQYPRGAWIALAAALTNVVFYIFTWSSWQDRFLLPSLLLLLPFGVDGLSRLVGLIVGRLPALGRLSVRGWSAANVLLSLVTVAIAVSWFPTFLDQYRGSFAYFDRPAGTRVDAGMRWTGPPRWVNDDDFKDVSAWIMSQTAPDAIVAVGQPWPLTFFTRRPSVLIPLNLEDADLHRFITTYGVDYLLIDGSDRPRRPYRDYLQGLGDAGVRATRVGSVTIFDTRALVAAPDAGGTGAESR